MPIIERGFAKHACWYILERQMVEIVSDGDNENVHEYEYSSSSEKTFSIVDVCVGVMMPLRNDGTSKLYPK